MSAGPPDSHRDSIPWTWDWSETLDSTNRSAAERIQKLWSQGLPAQGLAIAAQRQTAGRGQHGRSWQSPPGGVYFSLVVESVQAEHRARLALLAGVAVANVLVREGFEPRIRWPNDVLLKGKKIAGILCEALAQGEKWAAIIGIGLNVNTATETFSTEVRGIATSLLEQDGKTRSIKTLGDAIAVSVGEQVALVGRDGLRAIVERVRDLDALAGTHVRLLHQRVIVEGTGAGIADDGSLQLQTSGGTRAFSEGSISAAIA